jgi:ribosomal protein L11 methyltransferase
MPWLQISVEAERDKVEAITEAFDALGALSVTVLDAGDEPLLEPAPGETPLWSAVRLTALFEESADLSVIEQRLNDLLPDAATGLHSELLEDRDWSSTWRDSFGAMCFGRRLWVCPVGEQPEDPEAVVVHMDPGMAFGTGTHATTAMCLEWLDTHPPQDMSVIDYGCGSGILAISACLLGANKVTAVDIDQQALQATQENARRNDYDIGIFQPETLAQESVDLVVANILANPLIELAVDLSSLVHGGGKLVMTGILAEQAEVVMAAYMDWFVFAEPLYGDEWVLLEGLRR